MMRSMQIRKQGHCAYQCEYHLVIVSKYRRKILNEGSFAYFTEVMNQIREKMPFVCEGAMKPFLIVTLQSFDRCFHL
ncbi:transposase [Candidatus Bealeia paramacronuclearis]|uniref:transposase n=1 Tax=Candidatus Bealeia paramacronuclearis TaxID=1921001 RepID=UPI0039C01F63